MADWVTISSLATAGGTLVLAGATFASVRSANRAARVAELSLLAGLRPLLVPSHLDDPPQKVGFIDGKWFHVAGGGGAAEATDEAIYLVLALRNVGAGIAVLHGWRMQTGIRVDRDRPELDGFQRLTRDIYVAAGDTGFWQGSLRDPATDEFAEVRRAIEAGDPLTIDVLYGDHEGGQRVITRFGLTQREDGTRIAAAGRHWNVDRPDPR
jgi:hypothetical protein